LIRLHHGVVSTYTPSKPTILGSDWPLNAGVDGAFPVHQYI
jgi:hypothetical protein